MESRSAITPQTNRGRIDDEQFKFLRQYLSSRYGLRIPVEKKTLLESRLISRLNFLKLETIEAYLEYTFHSKEPNNEYEFFIEQITTHKTFFFRENYQFDFIVKILPAYCKKLNTNHPLTIWSAGCSTGEEVYTLGMLLNEQKADFYQDYKIIGTDISVPALALESIDGSKIPRPEPLGRSAVTCETSWINFFLWYPFFYFRQC